MKRALLVALPAVLAVGLVACGDDDDTTSATAANTTTVTTSATEPTEATDGTEATSGTDDDTSGGVVTLPGGGTIDIGSILPGGSLPDFSIPSIPDLSAPGISVPDLGSLVPKMKDILGDLFPKLTDEQLTCLADHLEGEQVEMSQIMSIIGECDINVQDLVGG